MPEINRQKLEESLGINGENQPSELDTIISDIPINDFEDDTIKENIDRANRMLDRVEDEMDRGNFNARMVEVFAKLIDSVTNAATQIQSSTYNNDYLVLKQKLAELKEYEVKSKVKGLAQGNTQISSQQNIIVSNREDILKILKGEKGSLS